MKNLTAQTFKNFIAIVTCGTVLAIGSSTYTYATPEPLTKESIAPVSTKLSKSSLIVAQASDLTGVWNCDDRGVYYIRQVGDQIWWYGESSDRGASWSNVFQGTIRRSGRVTRVTGGWADVPKGRNTGNGTMTLNISAGRITKISGGENFGGSVWTRR